MTYNGWYTIKLNQTKMPKLFSFCPELFKFMATSFKFIFNEKKERKLVLTFL